MNLTKFVKETINEFYTRSYLNLAAYPPKALIWSSKSVKENLTSKSKPEIWDMQTVDNYLRYLEIG